MSRRLNDTSISYADKKVVHMLRTSGAGMAGSDKLTGAAMPAHMITNDRQMIRRPDLERLAKTGY